MRDRVSQGHDVSRSDVNGDDGVGRRTDADSDSDRPSRSLALENTDPNDVQPFVNLAPCSYGPSPRIDLLHPGGY
jgi:hypothetical protein